MARWDLQIGISDDVRRSVELQQKKRKTLAALFAPPNRKLSDRGKIAGMDAGMHIGSFSSAEVGAVFTSCLELELRKSL